MGIDMQQEGSRQVNKVGVCVVVTLGHGRIPHGHVY